MHFGATMWFTEYSISPSELAVALEERGFESLWASEHSHLPVAGNSEGTHASAAEPERPHHVGPDRPTGRGVATQAPYPTPLAKRSLRRQTPEVGAVCGQAARTDLCGGRPVMGVPTAIGQVELFFKWIKQHLRIKQFYGTSENAVKTQIWIAVSVYVLVAIVRKRLKLEAP